LSCKKTIKLTFPRCYVNIATVPTISFKQAVAYNLNAGKLTYSKFTEEEISEMQINLNETIKEVNEQILSENKVEQIIQAVGSF
jgi:hypothetical protein